MSAMAIPEIEQVTPDDIVEYVMKNPENTNPAVLHDLIQTMLMGLQTSNDSGSELDPPPININ